MVDIKEIEEEIEKLENCDCTTYSICEKLAILYTVHDHLKNKTNSSSNVEMRSSAPMMNGPMMAH